MSARRPPRTGRTPPDPALERWRHEHLGRLLLRAFQLFERDMLAGLEASGIEGLRMSHFVVLRNTDVSGARLTEIARRAGLTKQAIGPLVHELVDAGVLELTPDPADGRAWLVRFTKDGAAGLRAAREVYERLHARYVERIGARAMRQLQEHLVAFVASGEAGAEERS